MRQNRKWSNNNEEGGVNDGIQTREWKYYDKDGNLTITENLD